MSKFPIPEEELPECFKNPDIINSLYAPIRDEYVNAEDRRFKLSSWKKIIAVYCTSSSQYTFSLAELKTIFYYNGTSPECLEDVFLDMINNGEIVAKNKFLETTPESWSMWLTNVFIKKPVLWSYEKLKHSIFGKDLIGTYIQLAVIKNQATRILSSIPDKFKGQILSIDEFLGAIKKDFPKLNAENAKLLVFALVLENKASYKIEQINSQSVYLLKLYSSDVKPISEIEVGIYKLKENEGILEKNVEHLEDQVQELINKAKSSVISGHRQLAKTYLRKKQEIVKRIDRSANALHNVQVMLERLHDSHTDATVIESYKQALASFKDKYSKVDPDSVAEVMVDIGDMLDIQEEITQTLSRSSIEDDSKYEEELEKLMKEDEDAKKTSDVSGLSSDLENLNISFPSIPKQSPNVSLPEAFYR